MHLIFHQLSTQLQTTLTVNTDLQVGISVVESASLNLQQMTANTESIQRCSQRRTLNMGQIWFPFKIMFICSEFVSATMPSNQIALESLNYVYTHHKQPACRFLSYTEGLHTSDRATGQCKQFGMGMTWRLYYLKHLMLYSDGRFARHPCFRYFALNT